MRNRTRQIQEKRGQSRKREQFRVDEVMGENLERFPTPGPMAPNVPGLGRPQGKEGSVRPEELSLVRPWVVESGPCPLSGDTCQPDCPGIVWEAEEPKLASDEAQPAFQAALPPQPSPTPLGPSPQWQPVPSRPPPPTLSQAHPLIQGQASRS